MGKKSKYKCQVHVNKDTVDTRRIRAEQRGSPDRYYSAKCYGDLNSSSLIGGTPHTSRTEFGIVGGILMAFVAFGMGGDDGSIIGIAGDTTEIKSLTHTDDIDIAITTDSISKPDCSANYNLGRWGYHITRCLIKSISRGS